MRPRNAHWRPWLSYRREARAVQPLSLDELLRDERLAAGELQTKNPQHTAPARDIDAVMRGGQHRSRRSTGTRLAGLRAGRDGQLRIPDAKLRSVEPGLGNRPGIERADAPRDERRVLPPVDQCLGLADFLGVGDAFGRLRHFAD